MPRVIKLSLLWVVLCMSLLTGCVHTQKQPQGDTQVDPLTRLDIRDELGRPVKLTRDTDPAVRANFLEELSWDTSIPQEPHQIILDELRRAREELKAKKSQQK